LTDKTHRHLRVLCCTLVLWVLFGSSIASTQPSAVDTTVVRDDANSTSKKNSFTSIFYGQPGKAALYSLVLPGAGQLYNKRWWKVPLVWAGEGFLVYNLTQRLETFQEVNTCRTELIESNSAINCDFNGNGMPNVTNTTEAFTLWQRARSNRDQAWIFLSIGHLVNVFEAFVDRHLINFDVSENLTLSLQPDYHDDFISQGSINIPATQVQLFSLSISLNEHNSTSKIID